MSLVFDWHPRKHEVTFVEAVSVFDDPLARIFVDENTRTTSRARSSLAIRRSHGALRKESCKIMKTASQTKAKPTNRFAERVRPGAVAVVLDPDVARVFRNAESVNAVLRALMTTMSNRRPPASC